MKWPVIFGLAALIDALLIILVAVNELYVILYLFTITAVGGGVYLLSMWNVDERTDTALDNASRDTITIFFVVILSIGLSMVIYSQFVSGVWYIIGVTLVVAAVILFYLQALMSAYYENRMR